MHDVMGWVQKLAYFYSVAIQTVIGRFSVIRMGFKSCLKISDVLEHLLMFND